MIRHCIELCLTSPTALSRQRPTSRPIQRKRQMGQEKKTPREFPKGNDKANMNILQRDTKHASWCEHGQYSKYAGNLASRQECVTYFSDDLRRPTKPGASKCACHPTAKTRSSSRATRSFSTSALQEYQARRIFCRRSRLNFAWACPFF